MFESASMGGRRREGTEKMQLRTRRAPRWIWGMLESSVQVTVRYAETDQMGFVYHGNYLPWFEVARTHMLKEQGIPYRQLEKDGYFLPVLEASMKYHRPALYDDTVTVHSKMKEKPTLRIRIEYEVRRGEELLVSGYTMHAFIDKSGRPVRPPPSFTERMEQLFPHSPTP